MILGVNKVNFWIYLICTFIATRIIGAGIVCFLVIPSSCADEILFGIGCGILPTIIIAYLMDLANQKRTDKKIMSQRDFCLFGFPYGALWLAKETIEYFYNEQEQNNLSFKSIFDLAVSKMENYQYKPGKFYPIDKFINSINYGLQLITQDTKKIIDNEQILVMNEIFTMNEIATINYAFNSCETIKKNGILAEMGEYIELLINDLYKDFPEIKNKMDRKIVVKDNHIYNWDEIQKQN